MPVYYYFLLGISGLFTIILIRSLLLRKKKAPGGLFAEALRDENSGNFEAAITTYQSALEEAKKKKFRDSKMENKIIAKLKVLQTNIDYNNNFHYSK